MRIFLKKSGHAIFYPYCPPTSCQVSENPWSGFQNQLRDILTDRRTHEGDIMEPITLLVQYSTFGEDFERL